MRIFWNVIASFLSLKPIRSLVLRSAAKRPHYRQLGAYMDRYWLLPRTKWLPFAIRVHRIKQPDTAPYAHNHPGAFRTFILSGGYDEIRLAAPSTLLHRIEGTSSFCGAGEYHSIVDTHGDCVTMVIEYGRWGERWGFCVDGHHIDADHLFSNPGLMEEGVYKECLCKHRMQNTGAVFFHSTGWLFCNNCSGWQPIKKVIK